MVSCIFAFLLAFLPGSEQFLLDSSKDSANVSSPVGDIVGVWKDVSVHGRTGRVGVYMGIPYAEPPVGNLRFRKPVPKNNLNSPFDARRRITCPQIPIPGGTETDGSSGMITEDCLILNIFAPESSLQGTKPVMIWIHGGGFNHGTSLDVSGEKLALMGDVIIVTINYRLAVYGFLSTDDDHARGNYGLWDQHLAIKWVHDNIRSFGGDPSQVTIFGESAGGASVIFQALYPGNKGLFQRAIAESGTAICLWAQSIQGEPLARQFASQAGCLAADWASTLACLRGKTSAEMNQTLAALPIAKKFSDPAWLPVVDMGFVVDDPRSMYRYALDREAGEMFNSIDLLIGVNSLDGIVYASTIQAELNAPLKDNFSNISRSQYERYLPTLVDDFSGTSNHKVVAEAAIFKYTDWSDPDDGDKRTRMLSRALTDLLFAIPAVRTASAHARSAPSKHTYLYYFAVAMPVRHIPVPATLEGPEAANHGDEIYYIFDSLDKVLGSNFTKGQEQVSEAMMTMWTNFAKSGNPNLPDDVTRYIHSSWPQYDLRNESYLRITSHMGPHSVEHRLSGTTNAWVDFMSNLYDAIDQCPEHSS